MRFLTIIFGGTFLGFLLVGISCNTKDNKLAKSSIGTSVVIKTEPIDSTYLFNTTLIDSFFTKHPKFENLKPEITELYQKHNYKYLWYDQKGVNEFAFQLRDKIDNIREEGIETKIPYKAETDTIFKYLKTENKPNVNSELLLSSLYFYYENKAFRGIDSKKTEEYGWFLPRKKQSFVDRLDSLLVDPKLFDNQKLGVLDQYYKLKEALRHYRKIEKNGGWKKISYPGDTIVLKAGDTSYVIRKIRKRLFITHDIKTNSGSNIYDKKLIEAVLRYKKRHALNPDPIITKKLVKSMNIPASSRIKTIEYNMERCRWISPDLTKDDAFIVINIPSFGLTFFRDGKPELTSKVVVGQEMNRTVVFSGDMSQIVFSPYWNIPTSILKKEILPAIENDPDYLEKHDMEWHNDRVRQKPGPKNSLGKVKFIFPNSNDIYLHDTPSKSLFNKERRAFSHGCIRVERPKDLAIAVLKGDNNWNAAKIDAAMNSGKQKAYELKDKIPVYIGYFTAWVDSQGNVNFYNDIYDLDPVLDKMMND